MILQKLQSNDKTRVLLESSVMSIHRNGKVWTHFNIQAPKSAYRLVLSEAERQWMIEALIGDGPGIQKAALQKLLRT